MKQLQSRRAAVYAPALAHVVPADAQVRIIAAQRAAAYVEVTVRVFLGVVAA